MKDMNREQYERDLAERQKRHHEGIMGKAADWQPCLHDQCSKCHGTHVTANGPCIHSISCPCPRCTPRC